MSRKIVLNTVAYQEILKENPRQAELISEIKSLGAENPIESAKVLKSYVQYVHIKNVRKHDGILEATAMESEDLDISVILQEFPESVPCAIEYPCGGKTAIKQKIQNDKKEIQSWVPVEN